MPVAAGRVILLNGPGSAGKSSLARALQPRVRQPLLLVEMDVVFAMLPPALQDHPDGVSYTTTTDAEGRPVTEVRLGPAGQRLRRGLAAAVRALAEAGNGLILDEVLCGEGDAGLYRDALGGISVAWIGVTAPLDVLEAREAARPDRRPGLSRWQYERVHREIDYDLTLDTSRLSVEAAAAAIIRRLDL